LPGKIFKSLLRSDVVIDLMPEGQGPSTLQIDYDPALAFIASSTTNFQACSTCPSLQRRKIKNCNPAPIQLSKMPRSEPSFLYKLVPSTAPVREPLPDRLPVSELDEMSGFVHLSTALQVPNTLKFFFKDEPLVYVLRIPYDRVAKDIRFEDPEGRVCGPRPDEGLFPVSLD
jgi:uncharacterized protein (DUF952 family)